MSSWGQPHPAEFGSSVATKSRSLTTKEMKRKHRCEPPSYEKTLSMVHSPLYQRPDRKVYRKLKKLNKKLGWFFYWSPRFKKDCRDNLRWARSGWEEKFVSREQPPVIHKIFQLHLLFFFWRIVNTQLREKLTKLATFLSPAAGQFCLVSYWQTASFSRFFTTPSQ